MKDMKMNIVTGFLVLIGLFAVLLGWLKLLDWSYTDNKDLAAAAIALIGAIVGGAISGLLTLLGVRITIQENHEKEFNESLPEKIMFTEDIINILERQLELVNNINENASNKGFLLKNRIDFILEYLEKDELLVKSSKVSLAVYRSTRILYDFLKRASYDNKLSPELQFEVMELMISCIKDIRRENDGFLKTANL